MLIKFESKSSRVKGLSFHPKRKWILASLHNGQIQLWDYGEKTLIDKFDEHKGPVRGINFHRHQPLFVSGGDDTKIKVWNYKYRRCLFTLDAHEDYIRTTFFHHEHPWILSASDDQSIRIWNWQSRSRIAVLTGHTHYITCAQFHPAMELILSASIDQTLRLWDITGLKMKSSASSMSSREEISSGMPEILSKTDYSFYSREAHDAELNWCCFHPDPSKNLMLSAADDNQIKVWRVDSSNNREIRHADTIRGHYNNVTCAVFHPKKDLILSVSEDKSMRIWDIKKGFSLDKSSVSAIGTHRREIDRFWIIAAHPSENLFAAGHDTGLILFKLQRERPPATLLQDGILFVKDNCLFKYNFGTLKKDVIADLRSKIDSAHYFSELACYNFEKGKNNPVIVSILSIEDKRMFDKRVYDLYNLNEFDSFGPSYSPESERISGYNPVFFGANRYAVLDNQTIRFRVNGEDYSYDHIQANKLFFAGAGRLFYRKVQDEVSHIVLHDVESKEDVASVKSDAKKVIMSHDQRHVALISSDKILFCDEKLNIISTIHEPRKIKSATWDSSGVLIYSTPVNVKYATINGDTNTMVSVQKVLYVLTVVDNKIFCLDRNADIKQIPVDPREFAFKQAVIRNDRTAILASLERLGSLTRAEISFLVKNGYPDLALKFVKDHHTRFLLALRAYDIEEALESAININDKSCWEQLASASMQVGHILAAERAYKELKQPYKLAMIYLVSDQKNKMLEARAMAKEMGDTSTEFIISLLAKDIEECVQIIRRCGHSNLAYMCALNHGLNELAMEILDELDVSQLKNLPSIEDVEADPWFESVVPNIGNSSMQNWKMLNDESGPDIESFDAEEKNIQKKKVSRKSSEAMIDS